MCGYFPPSIGGTQTYVSNLCLSLSKLGQEVDVLTMNTDNACAIEQIHGVDVTRCKVNLRLYKALFSCEFAKSMLRAQGYDILHIHLPFHYGCEVALLAAKLNNIPIIATHHGPRPVRYGFFYGVIFGSYYHFFYQVESRMIERLIFLSSSFPASQNLPSWLRKRIMIVKPAVNTEFFSPQKSGANIRARLGLSKKHKVVLFVGQLSRSLRFKGVEQLIEACKTLTSRHPDIRLLIVGGGDLLPEIQNFTKKIGADRCTIFAGFVSQDELPYYYSSCDIFVLPSLGDSLGLVVLEAMASGKPVIVTDIPGVRETVIDGRTGLTVPSGDSKSLKEAISLLLENEELRKDIAKNALSSVRTRSWENVAKEVLNVYDEVLKE